MKQEHISFRLSMELLIHIDAQAEFSNLSRTQVITTVLEKYFFNKDIDFLFEPKDKKVKLLEDIKGKLCLDGYSITRNEESRLKDFAKIPMPIFIVSTRLSPGHVVWYNNAAKSFFKGTNSEMEKVSLFETLKPVFFLKIESSSFFIEDIELFYTEGFSLKAKLFCSSILRDEHLKVCAIINNHQIFDTEEVNYRYWFSKLIADIEAPVIVINQKNCVFANDFALSLLGYSLDEFRALNINDLFHFENEAGTSMPKQLKPIFYDDQFKKQIKCIAKDGSLISFISYPYQLKKLGPSHTVLVLEKGSV